MLKNNVVGLLGYQVKVKGGVFHSYAIKIKTGFDPLPKKLTQENALDNYETDEKILLMV